MNFKIHFACAVLMVWLSASSAPAIDATQTEATQTDPHVEYWIRTLKTHPLKLVRKNAARSLGKIGNREAVPVLIDALHDAAPAVRVESAKALGYMGDERAFGPLYEAMSKGDRELKRVSSDSVDKIKAYQEYLKKKEDQGNL